MFKCVKGEYNLIFDNDLFISSSQILKVEQPRRENVSYSCHLVL